MMRNNLRKKTNKKGFTLVELIMVVALIAILAAIAVPTVSNVIKTANENVDKANAQTVELALKTADAELQAGTWTGSGFTHDTLPVKDALAHQGIALTTITDPTKSGATWSYVGGKVYCDSTHTTGTGGNASALNVSGTNAGNDKVKTVITP